MKITHVESKISSGIIFSIRYKSKPIYIFFPETAIENYKIINRGERIYGKA